MAIQKIISTIKNQYGDEIPSAVLFQEDGLLRLWEINCLSSLYNNLGNCHCENHLPSDEYPVSTTEVIDRFGIEALDGFEEPGREQLVFDAFGVELHELETFLGVAYMLDLNPLPALRKKTKANIVFAEDSNMIRFDDEAETIFIVNSRGEISVVTVEGRQEGGMRVLEGSTEPDLGDPDPVGMPELAIPAQLD